MIRVLPGITLRLAARHYDHVRVEGGTLLGPERGLATIDVLEITEGSTVGDPERRLNFPNGIECVKKKGGA